jgi:hypothetical protein
MVQVWSSVTMHAHSRHVKCAKKFTKMKPCVSDWAPASYQGMKNMQTDS